MESKQVHMEATTLKRPRILKKTHKNLEEGRDDPLTSLAEPLLHHILSYLTMKDVIRTSVLSKSWTYIWMYVPCLKFSPLKMPRSKEVAFINQSLVLHKGPAIQNFSLSFPQPHAEPDHVNSWIYFAKSRNVKELNLDFSTSPRTRPNDDCCYRLPHFLFSSTLLTVLSLNGCKIEFGVKFKLGSLKTLSLEYVLFSGGEINDLTDSTPILESLSLRNCPRSSADLRVYMIGGSTMKTLKIHESWQRSSNTMLAIGGDRIASLELVTSMSRKYYFISKMESLESASFSCTKVNCGQYEPERVRKIRHILDEVRHVKYLGLCSCYIQALCRTEEPSLNCLSFDASCLALKTDLTKGELPGISHILRHSPNVDTLILNIDEVHDKNSNNNSEGGDFWELQEPSFFDLLHNLKDVKINNFMKNLEGLEGKRMSTSEDFFARLKNDMNFLRFLLKSSKVMERMTIITFKDVNFGRNSKTKKINLLFQLTQELLAFPRASHAAQISFS